MAYHSVISLVDDDESIRESLQGLLRSFGFSVKVFASATEFLLSNQIDSTDCLILDVRMPGMDGIELQRHLVARDYTIPIIFITAHGDEGTRAQTLKGGAVAFLVKPFSEEALLNELNGILNLR